MVYRMVKIIKNKVSECDRKSDMVIVRGCRYIKSLKI